MSTHLAQHVLCYRGTLQPASTRRCAESHSSIQLPCTLPLPQHSLRISSGESSTRLPCGIRELKQLNMKSRRFRRKDPDLR